MTDHLGKLEVDMISNNYLEKVYSGFLGMNIGIRLGAPVEPTIWTYERIQNTYGDITDYVKEYKNFAADDDSNGPVYFLRALYDDAKDRPLEPQDVANAWLNYSREGVGMFWWGGYGISTEHTAYLNLKNGIKAPKSGSIEQNGQLLAEQIGGQIFIDTWGLVNPCEPERAAEYGQVAASVSHDGEGVNGARFFCACIAKAFESTDIREIIETGLSLIPTESTYTAVSRAVIEFYENNPEDWRECYHLLVRDWGYDKYGGVCHIIPNAGVCILAMLYGNGDFARTIEIATMCGWDTDCNAGNVGTVLGVMTGLEGLPKHYRTPMNDSIILSGISGYLNILDIPSYAKEVARLGYRINGEEIPKEIDNFVEGEIHFDFELSGSTHNMRLSNPFFCKMEHTTKRAYSGTGSLKVLVDRMSRGNQCKLYYKPFYRRDEFSDERYSPVLTPTVYSGQKVSMFVYLEQWNGWETLGFAPYIRTMSDKKDHLQGYMQFKTDEWMEISFIIPDTYGDLIDEVGIVIEGYAPAKSKTLGELFIDDITITGKSHYTIDISKQRSEFGTITPFSINHGAWSNEEGKLSLMRCSEAFAYTGNYFAKNYEVSTDITPQNGDSHLVLIRAQGAMRGYAGGLEDNKAIIYKNDFGYEKLAELPLAYENGKTYNITMKACDNVITMYINNDLILSVQDNSYSYGMYGCGSRMLGRTLFGDFKFKEE
jgi:ADP-ribosylglycohydrolase